MAWVLAGTGTGVTALDHSVIANLYSAAVIYAVTPELVYDQFCTVKGGEGATTVHFTKYTNMTAISSALTELNEATAVVVADAHVDFTPVEYGNVITRSSYSKLYTGGKLDEALIRLIGRNMGRSLEGLAVAAADAFGGTSLYPNSASAITNLASGDILDKTFANRLYNALARSNVPPIIGGLYAGIAHDDCLYDLRDQSAVGSWTDVAKYADANSVLRNEVGMSNGIRWFRSGCATVAANQSGTIDGYTFNVIGANALGKYNVLGPEVRISGPFDNLGRFVNIGWYWVGTYDTVDADCQTQGICASSLAL